MKIFPYKNKATPMQTYKPSAEPSKLNPDLEIEILTPCHASLFKIIRVVLSIIHLLFLLNQKQLRVEIFLLRLLRLQSVIFKLFLPYSEK